MSPAPITGLPGASIRLNAIVRWKPLAGKWRKAAAEAPADAAKAMAYATTWWMQELAPRLPVRGSRNLEQMRKGTRVSEFSKVGRGMLKKTTRPYVRRHGQRVLGGIIAGVHYAIWLAAGTRYIAKGRVMRWRPGEPTIKRWPAKAKGGNPRAELPIILPWHRRARDQLRLYLVRFLLG